MKLRFRTLEPEDSKYIGALRTLVFSSHLKSASARYKQRLKYEEALVRGRARDQLLKKEACSGGTR